MKIIFVCKGNIHRSPIAEQFFKKELIKSKYNKPVIVESYGLQGFILEPTKGKYLRDYPTEYNLTKPILDKKGINIDNHISQPLNERIIDEADLIITMNLDVQKTLLDKFPNIHKKTFLLNDLMDSRSIHDPYGSTDANLHENVINIIEYCIINGFDKIIKLAETFNKNQEGETQ